MGQDLKQAFLALDSLRVLGAVRAKLESGTSPIAIIDECRQSITEIGERFSRGEVFLSELIIASKFFEDAMALVQPHLGLSRSDPSLGRVVLGTVKGDIHDIGKNIVAALFRCEGFEVLDLGVDVPAQRFAEAVASSGAPVVGLSCLLTTGFQSMKTTIETLKKAKLRQKVFIMVGGGPVDGRVKDYVEADYAASDAVDGVRACRDFLKAQHEK